ncbi:Phospholipid:diacylglycerol acyltransferase [Aureobasidium pullulans EXF-150]|uniref:Phospholipid:diacylglycerol acyltransferase n=1 Tax=Aureobasidium pullulans EXF-150 TaxID=1043002 RepID=A0A074YSY8_AURPU|nr:Phospholipid:diacylglycerol acyltransferase [Aureobasidium pullulans EXF-150]KEQ89966.1 Phospholipid:diacylglycerol acyltransferase [Aureobasidium pullulans EXF-150]
MSGLRRRIFGSSTAESPSLTPEHSRESTPTSEEVRIVSAKKLDKLTASHKKKGFGTKRRNAWVFGLGGLFGILIAGFFASSNEVFDMQALKDMNLDSILDVLPAGLIKDAQALQKNERDAVAYDSFSVGLHAQSQGITAKHPVIMIPGVISTGLESWGTDEPSRQYFRKRLWGSWSMMRALVLDKAGWKRHIMLDKKTGMDPPGIKLRAAQGFDATDFFITGYWIWNKILENLATIGYDPTNAFTAAYDWRMSYMNYEIRDQYFTRLKHHIETAVQISDKKVVLLSHSMGSQVLYYFFHWVEAEGYGNGGETWVDDHIDSWINISGCMLGTPKGLPAVLSGEMKDTAQLNAFAVYGLDKFLSRNERAEMFRAMPGISSMLPIGGDSVWGDENGAPDDRPDQNVTYGKFLSFRHLNSTQLPKKNLTVEESRAYLFNNTEDWYSEAVLSSYSFGVAHKREEVEENQKIPRKWSNPLETRLPKAPNMKIYCFYGIGKETERAYYYREDNEPGSKNDVMLDTAASFLNPDVDHVADHGVVMGEGDGTVNLLSTGYMCNKGWRMRRYNPSGIKITTYEMPHEPDRFSPRGGPNTGDHVDILGRASLNDLILRIAGGKGDEIEETIHSNITQYAEKVKIWDD